MEMGKGQLAGGPNPGSFGFQMESVNDTRRMPVQANVRAKHASPLRDGFSTGVVMAGATTTNPQTPERSRFKVDRADGLQHNARGFVCF